MKLLVITALSLAWLGCLVEVAALASRALHVQHAGSIGAVVMLMGWLGLTGLCGWKMTRRDSRITA
jgi:hypothetical protein